MDSNGPLGDDELRNEYNLLDLRGRVRGKYSQAFHRQNHEMPKQIQAVSSAMAIVLPLAVLSLLTILPGYPTIRGPLNLVVMIPAFLMDGFIRSTRMCLFLATLVVPLFFLIWTIPGTWLRPKPPLRTVILAASAVAVSAISLACGYSFAIEYYGSVYVVGVITVSVICWMIVGAWPWSRYEQRGLFGTLYSIFSYSHGWRGTRFRIWVNCHERVE